MVEAPTIKRPWFVPETAISKWNSWFWVKDGIGYCVGQFVMSEAPVSLGPTKGFEAGEVVIDK